jgi:hypothetical protein
VTVTDFDLCSERRWIRISFGYRLPCWKISDTLLSSFIQMNRYTPTEPQKPEFSKFVSIDYTRLALPSTLCSLKYRQCRQTNTNITQTPTSLRPHRIYRLFCYGLPYSLFALLKRSSRTCLKLCTLCALWTLLCALRYLCFKYAGRIHKFIWYTTFNCIGLTSGASITVQYSTVDYRRVQ